MPGLARLVAPEVQVDPVSLIVLVISRRAEVTEDRRMNLGVPGAREDLAVMLRLEV